MKRSFRMREKILLLCLVISLSALLIQTGLYGVASSKIIYREAKNVNLGIMENMQNEILTYMKNIENNLLDIYNEHDYINDLRQEMPVDSMKNKWHRMAFNIVNDNFDTTDAVVALYLYTDNHEIISTYRRATTPKHNYPVDIYDGTQSTNAQIVQAYAESSVSTMLVSSYYNQYRQQNIGRFVLKIYNKSNISDMLGYVVCDVDTKILRGLMEKYSTDKETYIWLQPEGDRAITSIGVLPEEEITYYENITNKIQRGSIRDNSMQEQNGQVFFQVQQSRYSIGSYALMPQKLLEKNQRTLNRNLALISILVVICAVIFSFRVSHSLTKSLEKMTETVKQIQNGETSLRMTNLKADETGDLGQAFNEMLDQIETLVRREYEAKLMLNKAEYKALQAQINPHFLYNTLDTMASIAEIQECYEVSSLSQSLSNLFRYSLDMKNPLATVGMEITHLKNYIYVMDVRMRGEIKYKFDVDEDVLQDSLPRISIQPLVENAINHGLKNSRREKKVWICAKKTGENLQIEVRDNGVGISEEKIKETLRQGQSDNGNSIGITNINSRMKLLYGEIYGLQIKSKEGEGTSVYLTIPRRKLEDQKKEI